MPSWLLILMLLSTPAEIIREQKCLMCHAITGKGNPKGPLDHVGSKYPASDLREWLVNPQVMREKTGAKRTPVMKSFAHLSPETLDTLVAYLETLK